MECGMGRRCRLGGSICRKTGRDMQTERFWTARVSPRQENLTGYNTLRKALANLS